MISKLRGLLRWIREWKFRPMKFLLYNPDNGVTRNFMPHRKVAIRVANHHGSRHRRAAELK
jgi:hypothetical protein